MNDRTHYGGWQGYLFSSVTSSAKCDNPETYKYILLYLCVFVSGDLAGRGGWQSGFLQEWRRQRSLGKAEPVPGHIDAQPMNTSNYNES